MRRGSTSNRWGIETSSLRRNSFGAWAVVAVLSALLAAAGFLAYRGWTSTDVDVPTSGYVAMAFGVIFSIAVGVGLMALIFYSSRNGYDEPATLANESSLDADEPERK